jgi:transposase-like protein
MPKVSFTKEFREQAVRAVMAERSPHESRSAACGRLGPRLGVNSTTLYNWVKQQSQPTGSAYRKPSPIERPPALRAIVNSSPGRDRRNASTSATPKRRLRPIITDVNSPDAAMRLTVLTEI